MSEPYYIDPAITLHHGDARTVLAGLAERSIDSIVTDPPYGLSREPDITEVLTHWLAGDDYEHTGGGFMGASWDSFVPGPSVWREAFRVLKPGGYAVVFSATRTYDLTTVALRMAGFEVRDSLHWVYGQGWPKSTDVHRVTTQWVQRRYGDARCACVAGTVRDLLCRGCGLPSTAFLDGLAGFGTALKPAHEILTLARKPLAGTIAANVAQHGVGGLNIDASRVEHPDGHDAAAASRDGEGSAARRYTTAGATNFAATPGPRGGDPKGRFPANMLLTHANGCTPEGCAPSCPAGTLDAQSGTLTSGANAYVRSGKNSSAAFGKESRAAGTALVSYGDTGGASRFLPSFQPGRVEDMFDLDVSGADGAPAWVEPTLPADEAALVPFMYAKKAKGKERVTVFVPDPQCRPAGSRACGPDPHNPATAPRDAASPVPRSCDVCGQAWVPYQHPTVKPVGGTDGTGLLPWLVTLVTPPGGVTLDLYAGTGTLGLAAARHGFRSVLVERDPVHVVMCQARFAQPTGQSPLLAAVPTGQPRRTATAGRDASPAAGAADGSPGEPMFPLPTDSSDTPSGQQHLFPL